MTRTDARTLSRTGEHQLVNEAILNPLRLRTLTLLILISRLPDLDRPGQLEQSIRERALAVLGVVPSGVRSAQTYEPRSSQQLAPAHVDVSNDREVAYPVWWEFGHVDLGRCFHGLRWLETGSRG